MLLLYKVELISTKHNKSKFRSILACEVAPFSEAMAKNLAPIQNAAVKLPSANSTTVRPV